MSSHSVPDTQITISHPSNKILAMNPPPKKKPTDRSDGSSLGSSFICGIVKKPLGSNVVIAEKSRVLKRISKKDCALRKHIKWLKELQEERRRLEEKKETQNKEHLERKRLFIEREAKKRVSERHEKDPNPETEDKFDDDKSTPQHDNSIKNQAWKPAWCKSESAHMISEQMAEVDDEENLLDFVDNLDFDRYTEDLELFTLISQVKARIKTLQKEKKKDEIRLESVVHSENAALRTEALENHSVVDMLPSDIEEKDDDPEDVQSVANSVMSESSIGSIHSRKSLTVLVSSAKDRLLKMAPIEEGKEEALSPPIQCTHTDDNGARIAEKKSIAKLAFQNRNPAI